MRRAHYLLISGSLVAFLAAWLIRYEDDRVAGSPGDTTSGNGQPEAPTATGRVIEPSTGDMQRQVHPLTGQLGQSDYPPAKEPAVVYELLQAWRRIEGRFPAAEDNAGLMRQLTKGTSGRPALIGIDHQRINERGELVDGWGTPYFFHHVSGDYMEIRSAGPDRQMYTADDIIEPPPRAHGPSP